ncbi:MAG: hypothetical protein ACKODL_02750 [Phenylobacterium sp.]
MTSPETNTNPPLSGEDRLRRRRRRIGAVWIATIGAGFLGGVTFGLAAGGAMGLSPLVFWAGLALLAVCAVAASVWFMRRVDEVEVMDNLWASFAGLLAHTLISAGWVAAAARGLAPAPDVLYVLLATLGVTVVAYLGLKLRRRLG